MTLSKHVRDAARIIRRYFIAPARRRRLMRSLGCDDLITRIDVAKRQHRPCKAHEQALRARMNEALRSEIHG